MERVLIIIPTYNEEQTIGTVIANLRRLVPEYDLLVVNDGSRDKTGQIVESLGEKQLKLVSNLGYGPSLQTGIKYSLLQGYTIIVSFDADGQHRPEDVKGVVQALLDNEADMVIGSRYCGGSPYSGPFERRLGQIMFSYLTRLLTGKRIYDTTSGFKAMRTKACEAIVDRSFLDFHIETIIRLGLSGYKIIEHPIVVLERIHGISMHNYTSVFSYPLKTLLLILIAYIDVMLLRRKS
jgi:glycosyltransferase involved in cell wall biosynthesis